MAASLTGTSVSSTYDTALHLDTAYDGLTASYQTVYDGVGNAPGIRLKLNGVEIANLEVTSSLTFSGGLTLSAPLPIASGGTGSSTTSAYFSTLWTVVQGLDTVTAVSSDKILIYDTSESGSPKLALVSDISTQGTITAASTTATDGIGLFRDVSGSTLRFYGIAPASTAVTVVSNGLDVDIGVDGGKLLDQEVSGTGFLQRTGSETYSTISGASARSALSLGTAATSSTTDFAASTLSINTSTGISGGGNLSADRTLALDITSLTTDSSPTTSDYVLTYDVSASAHKKALISTLPGGGGGGAGLVDGDYGDVVVSGSGTIMTFDSGVVTTAAKSVLDDASIADMRATLDVQQLDAELTAIAGLTSAADRLPYFTGSGTASLATFTAAGRALIDDADATAQRATLGLGTLATQSGTFSGTSSNTNTGDQSVFTKVSVSGQSDVVADSTSDTLTFAAGSNVTITTDATTDTITFSAASGQPSDPTLTALAGAGTANTVPYFSATDTVTEASITATGISLLGAANAAAVRTTLSLVPGTDVQAYDAELAALAGLTSAADALPYFTGAGTASTTTLTAAARSVLDDTTVGAMLTTLGGQASDATLTALAAYNTNGILTQTSADIFSGRTITGTSQQITVTNGDGVAGNPTLSIPYNLALGSSATGPSSIAFFEDTDNGSNKVTISAASSLASDVTFTLPATNGSKDQVLTTDGSGVTSWATASGGGGGLTFSYDTTTAITAAVNYDYLSNNASLCTVTLPGTAAQGSIIRVTGMGAGKIKVAAASGDTIKGGSFTTASGGYFYSQEQYTSLTVMCITADTTWQVISSVGNFAIDAVS